MKLLLRNAKVYERGRWETRSVFIEGDRVLQIAPDIVTFGSGRTIDCREYYLMPGFCDVHVHLREPGFSYKERIRTGTRAAAKSGYTTLGAMPNLSPCPDSQGHLEEELRLIQNEAQSEVLPYGAITVQRAGKKIADLEGMAENVLAYSDDGSGIDNAEQMESAMRRAKQLGKIIASHSEDASLVRGGLAHDGIFAKTHGYPGICSESEWRQVEREIALCGKTGCRLHICHVSAKQSVALVREAKRQGINVSCETAPHYLLLCDEEMQDEGRYKMNPPIRAKEDREALLEGLLDGTIDCIATDHAPHSEAEKKGNFAQSAFGIVGLETAFPVLYTKLVKTGILPLERLAALMGASPRQIFGLPQVGKKPGDRADFALYDLNEEYPIDPNTFDSMGKSTPFDAMRVCGRNRMTVYKGEVIWNTIEK